MYVTQDDKNSSKYQVYIAQGGLSMPERSYYLDTDAGSKNIREKFVTFAGNMFGIMGYDKSKAKQAATRLMEMETAIAKTSRKMEDTRDPLANYNKITSSKLATLTPNIDWKIFLNNVGLTKVDSVVVGQPEFLTALNGYMKNIR
jgi:Predicted metalloendopeptidase